MACSTCGGSRSVARPGVPPAPRQQTASPAQTYVTTAPQPAAPGTAQSPGYAQASNPNAPKRTTV